VLGIFGFAHPVQAYVVLGQFLLLKKNKDLFVEWIKVICPYRTCLAF